MLSGPSYTGTFCTCCDVRSRYLLKHAYSERNTHTHTHPCGNAVLHSEFSVCHGKLGWRQSRLLGDVFTIYGAFFFPLSCSLFHTQTALLLCFCHSNARCKFLRIYAQSTVKILFKKFRFWITSVLYDTFFLHPQLALHQNFIFCPETTWTIMGLMMEREQEEN